MVEGYVHSDLRKGLRIAPFVERVKTTSLGSLNDNLYQYSEQNA